MCSFFTLPNYLLTFLRNNPTNFEKFLKPKRFYKISAPQLGNVHNVGKVGNQQD